MEARCEEQLWQCSIILVFPSFYFHKSDKGGSRFAGSVELRSWSCAYAFYGTQFRSLAKSFDWSIAVCNQGVPPFVHHYWTLEMPWNVLRNWFGDGSNFSLMAPKSYRGIVATPSHHHRITLNMFLHAARSLVLTFSYTLFIENDQERHVSNLFAPYVVQEQEKGIYECCWVSCCFSFIGELQ